MQPKKSDQTPAFSFDEIIRETPKLLLRDDLCACAKDPKFGEGMTPVYIPTTDQKVSKEAFSNPEQVVSFNPSTETKNFYGSEATHGLVYVPFPYVVPGGRFNEMYGWDTAFPVFAWTDHYPKIMREQVDNHLYQIEHYGKVLNANRTYYLSRSQPPLISAMVSQIWTSAQNKPWTDFDPDGLYKTKEDWLAYAYKTISKYYTYWTSGDRFAGNTGLSRYWDEGSVQAPEVIADEKGHYEHAKEHFVERKDDPETALFYDSKNDALTPFYYRADRTMRASGFDPTGHWGYGATRCIFHAPVCLNSFLFKLEKDMASFALIFKKMEDFQKWTELATKRKSLMDEYMLDPELGLYFDYDFQKKEKNRKNFATQFIPFWSGLYDGNDNMAKKAAKSILNLLETDFGIVTSTEKSGSQWDFPYGWPPLQYFVFEGLSRSGMKDDAKRVAEKFVTLSKKVYEDKGALYEKYNVVEGNTDVSVVHGYSYNVSESGTFLWTAAILELAKKLSGR